MAEDRTSRRPELKVWEALQEAEDGLTAGQIHDRVGMNHNTIRDVADALEQIGVVEIVETGSMVVYRGNNR